MMDSLQDSNWGTIIPGIQFTVHPEVSGATAIQ